MKWILLFTTVLPSLIEAVARLLGTLLGKDPPEFPDK